MLQGLDESEARRRLIAEGPNELPAAHRRGLLRIVREILREPMFALLIGAAVVYLLLGDVLEGAVLLLFASSHDESASPRHSRRTIEACSRAGGRSR
jgi:Ca2+-transporting ATPase